MATIKKLYLSIINGMQDSNIKFRDLQKLLDVLGFECRIKGDHFIYSYNKLPENINIQPKGNMAKALPGKTGAELFTKISNQIIGGILNV